VCRTKVDRTPALLFHIFAAAQHIRNHSEAVVEVTQLLLMHAEKCIESQDGHSEQFL
jgi:hypothetical protein